MVNHHPPRESRTGLINRCEHLEARQDDVALQAGSRGVRTPRTRSKRLVSTAGVLAFLTSCWISAPAFADDGTGSERQVSKSMIEEAQRHYTRGIELFKNSIYDAALVEFKRAYEIAPSYKIQYNIGQVSRQLDDYASAVIAYRQYLSEGGVNISAARQAEVKAELERIEQWVGRIEVASSSPDAEIVIDDVVVGRTPLSTMFVNAGRRRVTATLPGHPSLSRIVDLAGGETEKVVFDFTEHNAQKTNKSAAEPSGGRRRAEHVVPSSKHRPAPSTKPEPAEPPSQSDSTSWLLWGGTAVLAAGAVGVGALAFKASNELEDVKRSPATTADSYDSLHSKMTRLAVAADVLGGLAVVTGGVALYMTLRPSTAKRDVGIVVLPNGVLVRHTF